MKLSKDESNRAPFHVGKWRVHPKLNRISCGSRTEKVEPKVMQVLQLLAANHGEPVTREELMTGIWSDEMVTEDSLNRAISRLRNLFDDDPKQASVIETIPKVGYRLLAPVAPDGDNVRDSEDVGTESEKSSRITILVTVMFLIVVISISGFLVAERPFSKSSRDASMVQVTPVTTLPGIEFHPALSQDGSRILFVGKNPSTQQYDIYVKQLGAETALGLTSSPGVKTNPHFSPDGQTVAFVKIEDGRSGIYLIPATGGRERKLIDGTSSEIYGLDWSPDGTLLVYTDKPSDEEPRAVFLLTLSTLERRPLTSPPTSSIGDEYVAFAPDGAKIAFTRSLSLGVTDVYTVTLSDGVVNRVTHDDLKVHGLDWSADGGEIIYSSNRGGEFSLWRVNAEGGGRPKLAAAGNIGGEEPDISHAGGRLAFESWREQVNIYEIGLPTAQMEQAPPRQVIASTRWDWNAQISPDGTRLAFISDRSGSAELWTANLDGGALLKLTSFGGPYVSMPAWSPDGRDIVFDVRVKGSADIYRVDAQGGAVTPIATESSEEIAPSYSSDRKWIYFTSNRKDGWQIWKAPASGGEAIQVTENGGFRALETEDGQFLFYTKKRAGGIWRMPTSGGKERLVIHDLHPVDWPNWVVSERGIFYINRSAEYSPSISFFDFSTEEVRSVTPIPDLLYKSGLSLTADQSHIFFARVDERECDIMLLENY